MNQKNYDYLKDQVKFTGFGDGLEKELKAQLEKQQPEFQLHYNHEFGKDKIAAVLHFRKSEQNDMYFFNKYDLTLAHPNNTDVMRQTFYLGKENNFTLKEGYNLMAGRAVNKELVNRENQAYNAWVQLNFKESEANGNYKMKIFHHNYGYDLASELSKHPIKELQNDTDRTRLMESLQKGNRQAVTFIYEGKEQKRFVEANPQFKSVNIYDGNMNRIRQSQKEKETPGESIKQEKKQQQKQSDDPGEETPAAEKKQSRKKRQAIS